jgi:ABC-type glycerol-3-phosphate transport system substrate-binding protein
MNQLTPASSDGDQPIRTTPNRILTFFIALMLILLLVKCSSGMSYTIATATPSVDGTDSIAGSEQTPESIPESGQQIITIWLPPEFDPSNGSAAGEILNNRLLAFEQLYPGVDVQVRIKALDGSGGLMESLTVTSAAAPQALPSLIALPRAGVEEAALRELIQPINLFSGVMEDGDWYPFAVQLASVQNVTYGIPFAGDVQVLTYQETNQASIQTWDSIMELGRPVFFAVADTQSNFTLALYLSEGGELQDDLGRPMLQEAPLVEAFQFLNQGAALGIFPASMIGLQNEGQVWNALNQNPDALGVVSASSLMGGSLPDWHIASIPPLGPESAAIADGWMLCLTETDAGTQPITMRLAEYLTDSEFMTEWTEAAGYLSMRPSALAGWQQDGLFTLLDPILSQAQVTPSIYVISAFGQNLATITRQVLQFQISPQDAAQSILDLLEVP